MSRLETACLPADRQRHLRQEGGVIAGTPADPGELMGLSLPGSFQAVRKFLREGRLETVWLAPVLSVKLSIVC